MSHSNRHRDCPVGWPFRAVPVAPNVFSQTDGPEGPSYGRFAGCWLLFVLAASLTGCSLAKRDHRTVSLASHDEVIRSQSAHIVYVTGHGWHTGLVLKTRDIPPDVLPEILDFQGTDSVEFGWGDEGFYRAKKITPGLIAKAALVPTPSVLHIAGFRGPVEEFFTASDLVELNLDDAQFAALCQYIADTFDRSDFSATDLGQGLYGYSRFYRAQGSYYFPKTCNVWTAGALQAVGLRARAATALTAENVLKQARRFGRDLQQSPSWVKHAALGE